MLALIAARERPPLKQGARSNHPFGAWKPSPPPPRKLETGTLSPFPCKRGKATAAQ